MLDFLQQPSGKFWAWQEMVHLKAEGLLLTCHKTEMKKAVLRQPI